MIWLEILMVLYALAAAVVACSLLWAALHGIPYVPSDIRLTENIFRRLKLPPGTTMVDLGSGDGRIVLLAATRFHWQATGIEINPLLNLYARIRRQFSGATTAKFITADLLSQNLNGYRVIFIYGFPAIMQKLRSKLASECRPGTWIISHSFSLPDTPSVFSLKDTHVYRTR